MAFFEGLCLTFWGLLHQLVARGGWENGCPALQLRLQLGNIWFSCLAQVTLYLSETYVNGTFERPNKGYWLETRFWEIVIIVIPEDFYLKTSLSKSCILSGLRVPSFSHRSSRPLETKFCPLCKCQHASQFLCTVDIWISRLIFASLHATSSLLHLTMHFQNKTIKDGDIATWPIWNNLSTWPYRKIWRRRKKRTQKNIEP